MVDIKDMQLYPRADRILVDLRARGLGDNAPLSLDDLTGLDQLHYHGTLAIDEAVTRLDIDENARVLEIGSGWGGPARYLAGTTGAHVTAVELQRDYNDVALDLTARAGLSDRVDHVAADFLTVDLPAGHFTHVVSWLALYHIPRRADYLGKAHGHLASGGQFWAEDLTRLADLPAAEEETLRRHLFPNSLVDPQAYGRDLASAGFDAVICDDMTSVWRDFTATRLQAFRETAPDYAQRHGDDGRAAIQTFYEQMADYFARGVVGGIRAQARKP